MNMLYRFPLVLAILLAGCEKNSLSELPSPGGEVKGAPSFVLPGPVHRFESYYTDGRQSRQEWRFVKSEWKPKGWSLWLATNAYSSWKHPRDNRENMFVGSGYNEAPAPWDRAEIDGKFLKGIKNFVNANNVPVEINFLGYDTLPDTLLERDKRWGNGGKKLSYHDPSCQFAFAMCIDNYFISPASRFVHPGYTSFKEWITPYLHFRENDQWGPQNLKQRIGDDGEQSLFYDWWPTMVFLVNPEGNVVRAWLPQTQSTASVNAVIAGLVTDMELGGNIIFDPKAGLEEMNVPIRTSEWSYYGEYFLDAGARRLGESIMRARGL
jgi:hypothetical protein